MFDSEGEHAWIILPTPSRGQPLHRVQGPQTSQQAPRIPPLQCYLGSLSIPETTRRLPLLLALLLPAAAPAGDPLPLDALLETYNLHAHFPLPDVDRGDLRRLEDGKVLKLRDVPDDPKEPIRVVGLLITDEPRDELWLANRDTHYSVAEGATEVLLTPRGQWPQIWYQHIDAPRPFSDRHWTIDVSDSWQLARATDGRCWEHWWALTDDGLAYAKEAVSAGRVPAISVDTFEDSIYTPANQGAWLMCALEDGRTLLGYHTKVVVGGRIPDRIIADWGMATLGRMFRKVESQAREQREHYTGGHYLIHGGDGQELPLY